MSDQKFCAHRGVSALMPENTLSSFAAAWVLGADEIEWDVRLTRDGQMIVSHDNHLARISNGEGLLAQQDFEQLRQVNIGIKHDWTVHFCTPEEVFALFAGKITFNIHLKEHGENGSLILALKELVDRYDVHGQVYFAGSPSELEWMQRVAPEIPRTAIQLPRDTMGIYEMAHQYDCHAVQLWLGMFDKELIEKLHHDGIRVNLYYADTAEDYQKYFAMGVDTLLTNRMDLAAEFRRNNTSK